MLTNDQLFEKYGKDIVFLFKGDEPYVEALGSPMGVLIERDDKVLCNICEGWFPRLGYHLHSVHKMNASEYKEMFGFNDTAPLCSRKESERKRQLTLEAFNKNPTISQKIAIGRKKAHETIRQPGYRKQQPRKRMQGLNIRNACPEQMKQRYRMVQAKYGADVSLNIIRVVDSGLDSWACRHYGSWNAFKEALGEPTDTSSYPKDKAVLICDLREYVAQHGKLPWNVHTHQAQNGFPHSEAPYITKWGKMSMALLACGITSEYVTRDDGYAEKSWSVDYNPELIEESMKRLQARALKMPERKAPHIDKTVKVTKVNPIQTSLGLDEEHSPTANSDTWTSRPIIPGTPQYARASW